MDDWDRHVEFEACSNYRDLGGYATIDDKEVRRGALYRSDSLHRLSPDDLATLAALRVRAVIDSRTSAEVAGHGRAADHEERLFKHLPCPDASDDHLEPRADIYLPFAQLRGPQIATALQFIAHEDGPIVFHCMAGKDRTGVLAALLLAAFGVPDSVIAEDYALTERSLAPATAWASEHEPEWAAWFAAAPSERLTAPSDAMLGFLRQLRAADGTVEDYFASTGVEARTLDALRVRYLA